MKKKKGKILGLLAMAALLLTGCVDSMPELTAEQSNIISEYAAGLLLKYSPKYDYKIVSEEELAAALEAEQEQEESEAVETETEAEGETQEAGEASEAETETPETQTQEIEILVGTPDTDFAAELGMDDLALRYQSFELCDSYPQDNDGFSVSAAQGKKLLVVHFDLSGSSGQEVACNLFDYAMRIRFTLNDTTSINAWDTMLPNELATYMDMVPEGEAVDVVAVAEISDMTEDELSSLMIQISTNDGSCTAKLK